MERKTIKHLQLKVSFWTFYDYFNVVSVAAYMVSVLEGIVGGTMVLQVTADDADVGVDDDLNIHNC